MSIDPELLVSDLEDRGFHQIDDFLEPSHFQALRTQIQDLYLAREFQQARVGQRTVRQESLRRDSIYWLDKATDDPALKAYFRALDQLSTQLNQAFFLGLRELEAHFAAYEPGSFYAHHVDQFLTNQDRKISCVYYLNDNWQDSDGGALRLYGPEEQILHQLSPQGNRFICFRSDLAHEVQEAKRLRYSIAAWLKVRAMA